MILTWKSGQSPPELRQDKQGKQSPDNRTASVTYVTPVVKRAIKQQTAFQVRSGLIFQPGGRHQTIYLSPHLKSQPCPRIHKRWHRLLPSQFSREATYSRREICRLQILHKVKSLDRLRQKDVCRVLKRKFFRLAAEMASVETHHIIQQIIQSILVEFSYPKWNTENPSKCN